MKDEKLASNYELEYWMDHKGEEYKRAKVMLNMFSDLKKHKIVADVGCGPLSGIFHDVSFTRMFAIDPLWDKYKNDNLIVLPNGVEKIKSTGQNFILEEKADLIVSFNALDHSGNLKKSIDNIMNNLSEEGRFCFHLHMRTKEQLNEGHQMLITERIVDDTLKSYKVISKTVGPDPFAKNDSYLEAKKYLSYVAEVRHAT